MVTKRVILGGTMLAGFAFLLGVPKVRHARAGTFPVMHTDAEWQAMLSPAAYDVLRDQGTEAPFSSPLDLETRQGLYNCAGCAQAAYSSATKYDSGTGWPSFWASIKGAVTTASDSSFGMDRTEVHCSRCGSHLGHVFPDGPQPTGLRYCMNGVALTFHRWQTAEETFMALFSKIKASPGRTAAVGVAALLTVAVASGHLPGLGAHAADLDQRLSPPAVDEPASAAHTETAIFAGGCFWGVQGVFQHVRGVTEAMAGYDGGQASTAQYETVSTGTTGHAESVRVTFDPQVISYGHLLQIFFSVVTDPTQVNEQYPDTGTQYRSELFTNTSAQAKVASLYIAQLDQAKAFSAPIATIVGKNTGFYPAEGYHQNYLTLNPDSDYIATFDLPKIDALSHVYPSDFSSKPVLVADSKS